MMFAVVNQNNRIIAIYDGNKAPVKLALGERFLDLPDDFNGVVGNWLDELDEQMHIRPLKDRVADGTARDFPPDMTVNEDGEPRYKSRLEKILEGIEEEDERLAPTEKIVGDQIVPKTDDELLAEGLITQAQWDTRQPQPDPRDEKIKALEEQVAVILELLEARKP